MQQIKNILQNTAKLVDNKFHTQRQYINFLEFISHNEFELALESLIELSEETGENFTVDYWKNLNSAANKMDLKNMQDFFTEKIEQFK